MDKKEAKLKQIYAVLSQKKELPPFPEHTEERIEIPFISKENICRKRPVRLFLPKTGEKKVPLVFSAHYELAEESAELRMYLSEGWAVASAAEFDDRYNAELYEDDLVFNNAALWELSRRPEIDRERIAVVGGSAGGYTTLMLSALRLGICGSVARSAIANLLFNFRYYAPYVAAFNEKALETLNDKEKKDLAEILSRLPIPFAAVLRLFRAPEGDLTEELLRYYEQLSPTGLCGAFSSPFIETHFTSDILVPVDQVSRRYTHQMPGQSLPQDFKLRLSDYPLDGVLSKSFEEELPKDLKNVRILTLPEVHQDIELPFDPDRPFTIDIYEEGAPEAYAGHSLNSFTEVLSDLPFLRYCFSRGCSGTNFLTKGKIRILLERYTGCSVNLPAHEGADDSVYGSLAVYREEILEMFRQYRSSHPDEKVVRMLREAAEADSALSEAAEEIIRMLLADHDIKTKGGESNAG